MKAICRAFGKIFKGPKHTKQDDIDAIALTTQLMKILKNDGPVALESHLENPADSTIYGPYSGLLNNKPLIDLISDTLTLLVVSSGTLETNTVEEVPAMGIVAAVLGVVKPMGSINEPPEVLGKMIGAALVGTFLGVLLAYGIVGPLASRLKQILD